MSMQRETLHKCAYIHVCAYVCVQLAHPCCQRAAQAAVQHCRDVAVHCVSLRTGMLMA